MVFGTFTLVIDGERLDGTPENKARLHLTAQGPGTLRDDDGDEFKFPAQFAKSDGVSISLPYDLTLFTDSIDGNSTTIGYEGHVRTDYGRVTFQFAAPEDGSTVQLVDLTDDVVTPISDLQQFRDEAEAAQVAAEAAAGDAAAVVSEVATAAYQREPVLGRRSTTKTMIGAHYSGHGWTIMATANTLSSDLNDTTTYALGTQSAKIVTATTALDTGFKRSGLTAIDFTGCDVRVRFRYDSFAKLGLMYVMLYNADGTSFVNAPSLIDLTSGAAANAWAQPGDWLTIDIPWSRFTGTGGTFNRAAVTDVRVYVRGKSGQSATTNLSSVEAIPQDGLNKWPNGALVITMDDCMIGQATLGIPYLDRFGDRATLFPIVGATSGTFFTADLLRFRDMGHEIGAHASSLTVHNAGVLAMTDAQLVTEMETLRQWQVDNDFSSRSYAYPLGQWSPHVGSIVARYYESARLSEGGFHLTARPSQPYGLRTMIGGVTSTPTVIKAEMDKAKSSKGALTIMYHQFLASGAVGTNQTNIADFQQVVDYAHTIGMPIVTQGELIKAAQG